jgi:hypothetical protein
LREATARECAISGKRQDRDLTVMPKFGAVSPRQVRISLAN